MLLHGTVDQYFLNPSHLLLEHRFKSKLAHNLSGIEGETTVLLFLYAVLSIALGFENKNSHGILTTTYKVGVEIPPHFVDCTTGSQ